MSLAVSARTMRTPGWASHRAMSAVSSTSAPPSGAGCRQNRLCRSANRVDDRHRRNPAPRVARRGELAVPDDREVPAACAVGARGDQFVDRGQRPQPLAPPQRRRSRWPRGRAVRAAVSYLPRGGQLARCGRGPPAARESSAPAMRAAARAAADGVRGGRRRRGAAGHGDSSTLGAGRPVQRRTAQPGGAGPHAGEAGQQGRGLDGVGAGPKRSDRPVVLGCPHDREPGEGLVGEHHPPPPVRKLRAPVVRRSVRGEQPSARGRPPRARARTRRGRPGRSATPSPSSGCAGRRR